MRESCVRLDKRNRKFRELRSWQISKYYVGVSYISYESKCEKYFRVPNSFKPVFRSVNNKYIPSAKKMEHVKKCFLVN